MSLNILNQDAIKLNIAAGNVITLPCQKKVQKNTHASIVQRNSMMRHQKTEFIAAENVLTKKRCQNSNQVSKQ